MGRQIITTTALALAIVLGGVGHAQTAAPTLAEVDRLRVTTLAQAMELAQLKAQAAQRDYDQARDQLRALLPTLERAGYVLDLSTLTYQPAKASEPAK